jgi:hypothetical protein
MRSRRSGRPEGQKWCPVPFPAPNEALKLAAHSHTWTELVPRMPPVQQKTGSSQHIPPTRTSRHEEQTMEDARVKRDKDQVAANSERGEGG